MMYAHPTQATAARQIAGIFGGNLGPLSDAHSLAPALYRTGDPQSQAPGTPSAPLTPEQQEQVRREEVVREQQTSGAFLTMAALGIGVAALRGGLTGAVAASNWSGASRGALFNGSLAAVGVGVAGYVVGQKTAATGLLVTGLIGTAGAVYLAMKKRK
jgi:hypothetical protein